jgi:hypothetical protein
MTRYATLREDEAEAVQLQQLKDLEAGTVRYARRSTSPLPHTGSASTPLSQSPDMSDDRAIPSTTATAADGEDQIPPTYVRNLYAAADQSTHPDHSLLPPSYSGPISTPLREIEENSDNNNSNIYNPTYEELYQPHESSCCGKCCAADVLGPCICFLLLIVFVAICFWVVHSVVNSIDGAREHTIEVFKSDCLAHGGSLQTHMDAYTKKSWSCLGAGNDTVTLGG